MEYIRHDSRPEGPGYESVVDYLYEGDGEHLRHRAEKLITTIDELLVYDDNGTLCGILDGTYLNDQRVRQLAGKTYVQTEELDHMTFILNTTASDLIALDEIELNDGTTVGDRIDDSDVVEKIKQFNAKTDEDFIARRAYLIRAACDILLEDMSQAEQESYSA